MIAALWGVSVWHEFRGASAPRQVVYLAGMVAAYLLALVLVALAYKLAQ